ncbi:hypothetical protein X975_11829, partial [Stegodyphus mimosarum]
MKFTEQNCSPALVLSHIATKGRFAEKRSLTDDIISGVGKTLRCLTGPCLQERTS